MIPGENEMPEFIEVARVDQIPPGSGARFTVANKDIALFNVDGTICAIADTCPHAGGSLGLGKLNVATVTCPMHGMKFDVTTGCFAGTSHFWSRLLSGKGGRWEDHGGISTEKGDNLTRGGRGWPIATTF